MSNCNFAYFHFNPWTAKFGSYGIVVWEFLVHVFVVDCKPNYVNGEGTYNIYIRYMYLSRQVLGYDPFVLELIASLFLSKKLKRKLLGIFKDLLPRKCHLTCPVQVVDSGDSLVRLSREAEEFGSLLKMLKHRCIPPAIITQILIFLNVFLGLVIRSNKSKTRLTGRHLVPMQSEQSQTHCCVINVLNHRVSRPANPFLSPIPTM